MKQLFYGMLTFVVCVLLFFFNTENEVLVLSTIEFDFASEGIVFLNSPEALIGQLSDKSPEAIVISAFDYIHYFEKLRDYKALFSMPYNASLWQNSDTSDEAIHVMLSPSLMDDYLVSESLSAPYTLTRQKSMASGHQLFFESYVTHVVSTSPPPHRSGENLIELKDLESLDMGFVLILIKIESPEDRINWITEYFDPALLSPPDENQLQEAIHWLFIEKHIKTRYYYDDLVFSHK